MVLLRDIDKPKGCGGCGLNGGCTRWAGRNWGAPPPENCPVISLDDVIAQMEKMRDETQYWYDGLTFVNGAQECIRILRELEGKDG